jgi:hypothetical protein
MPAESLKPRFEKEQAMPRPVRHHTGKFPPKRIDWERLIPLIGPAGAALARYDGLLSAVPNADVLLSPLTTQEASGQKPAVLAFPESLNIGHGSETTTRQNIKRPRSFPVGWGAAPAFPSAVPLGLRPSLRASLRRPWAAGLNRGFPPPAASGRAKRRALNPEP